MPPPAFAIAAARGRGSLARMTTPLAPTFLLLRRTMVCAALLLAGALPGRAAELLEAGKPLVLAGTYGRFDFLALDVEGRRLLAAHTGNGRAIGSYCPRFDGAGASQLAWRRSGHTAFS